MQDEFLDPVGPRVEQNILQIYHSTRVNYYGSGWIRIQNGKSILKSYFDVRSQKEGNFTAAK